MGKYLGTAFFIVVLLASLAGNVSTALNERAVPFAGLQVDSFFPAVWPRALDGEPADLDFRVATIVYFFSPGCEWCVEDYPSLVQLATAAQEDYRIVGLARMSIEAPTDAMMTLTNYLRRFPFPGDVMLFESRALSGDERLYRDVGITPQMVVVAPGGRILMARTGALLGDRIHEAEQFFGVRLSPGQN